MTRAPITTSTVARIAGNIAAGMLPKVIAAEASEQQYVAQVSVAIAWLIVALVEQTADERGNG